jgi:hypothetical protein
MVLIVLVSAGCSAISAASATPTVVTTPTPERLKLINGAVDACMLLTSAEVETISGIKVISNPGWFRKPTFCQYISVKDEEIILVVSAETDTTLRNANESYSAAERYEIAKRGDLRMEEAMPDIFTVEDINNLGDKAFLSETNFLSIHILNNNIYYVFDTAANGGIGYDALMKLTRIALQRMPLYSPFESVNRTQHSVQLTVGRPRVFWASF